MLTHVGTEHRQVQMDTNKTKRNHSVVQPVLLSQWILKYLVSTPKLITVAEAQNQCRPKAGSIKASLSSCAQTYPKGESTDYLFCTVVWIPVNRRASC